MLFRSTGTFSSGSRTIGFPTTLARRVMEQRDEAAIRRCELCAEVRGSIRRSISDRLIVVQAASKAEAARSDFGSHAACCLHRVDAFRHWLSEASHLIRPDEPDSGQDFSIKVARVAPKLKCVGASQQF